MIYRLATMLHDNRRGSVTVEFALVSLFFFAVVMVALDFGIYTQQRLKLANAVEQGAILAFNSRDAVDVNTVANFVKAQANLTTAPTVTCNNGSACAALAGRSSTDFRCINAATGAIDATPYSAGAGCASGGNAGYYLKIVATRTFSSVVVPDRWLGGSAMTQTTVVRLQ